MAKRRPAPPPTRRVPRGILPAVLLVILTAWTYSTSFRGVFVWDDGLTIVENRRLTSLWPLTKSMSTPPDSTVAGRPLAAFSLAVSYALAPAEARDAMSPGGPDAPPGARELFYRNIWGYHFFNLAIHALAALTLFGVVRRTLTSPALADRFGRWSSGLAFVVALLWAVHPLQTESVTYVVQRVESLMGLLYLLTLYCAIRAWAPGSRRRWWTAAAIAVCAGGMATKEVMVGAPLLVALWDRTFGRDAGTTGASSGAEASARRWPLYAGLAATWLIVGVLAASLPRSAATGFGFGWTWWSYLVTQTAVITHYLRLALFPVPLVFDYGWPPASSLWAVAPQAALLVALFVLTGLAVIARKPIGFPGAWFFVVLAPSSSVIPIATEVAAEHRMYLPLAAVIAVVVLGSGRLLMRVSPTGGVGSAARSRRTAVAGLVVAGMIALTLAWMTHQRNRDYWDDEGLWRKTVADRPQNARAHAVYAVHLLARRQYPEAEAQLREAIRLDDSLALAHLNMGIVLCAGDKTGACIAEVERAIALDPRSGESYGVLGEAYLAQGRPADAIRHFLRALDLLPDNRASRFLLTRTAWLLATLPEDGVRDGAKAVALAERAVNLTARRDARAVDTLGAAYAESGRFPEAVAAGREAVAIAEARQDNALAAEIRQHLSSFEHGRKLRQSQH